MEYCPVAKTEGTIMIRRIILASTLLALPGCGGASASAGASVSSDGTVSAGASASVDTPAGDYTATTTAGTAVDRTVYTRPVQGYAVQTTGCTDQWVHMPLVINFPSGGAIIDAQNRGILQEMVLSAQGRQDIVAVRVEGHTDHCGREVNNVALSQERARSVANELVSMGVPAERIQIIGYGSSMPRANESCERQAQEDLSRNMNRRVEFSLLVCR